MNSFVNKTSKSVVKTLLYQYAFVLFLAVILRIFDKDISNYNGYVVASFAVTLFFYTPQVIVYLICLGFPVIIMLFSTNNINFLHIIYDTVLLFYIISSIFLCNSFYFSKKEQTFAIWVMFALILLSVLNIINPLAYSSSQRYGGIFSGTNASSNIFAIISIFYWELFKRQSIQRTQYKLTLLFLIISVVYYTYVSQTRTLLFTIPYWLYQLFTSFNRKIFVFSCLLILVTISDNLINLLQGHIRLTEDSSYLTRATLYRLELNGIMENYAVIPHGAHAATDLVVSYTSDEKYTPHNDFLRYIYDWGIIFICLLLYIIRVVTKIKRINWEVLFFFFAFSGFALHNMFFLPYVWMAMIFILMLWNSKVQ